MNVGGEWAGKDVATGNYIFQGLALGDAGCTGMTGDVNGDGKADAVVACRGQWAAKDITTGAYLAQGGQLGDSGCQPSVNDVTGDGKADFIVDCAGQWAGRDVATGNYIFQGLALGDAGCRTFTGDVDGNRTYDAVVNCSGQWAGKSISGPYIFQGLALGPAFPPPGGGGTASANATSAVAEARTLAAEGSSASARVRALFQNSEWSPGPVGEWAGDCPKLPYAAWYFATNGSVKIEKRDAITNYNYYASRGLIQQGTPPAGAVTYYSATPGNAAGHTALSLGDGTVATTTGLDGAGTANTIKPYQSASSGTYLGYYLPG